MDYSCGVDAEPLHRYRTRGYHPVRLGDRFAGDRYEILHKLGWGGYSITWIARDRLSCRNVALKITISEASTSRNRERQVLEALWQTEPPSEVQHQHVVRLFDAFKHVRPNGTHDCLILELLGPSIPTIIEARYSDRRLPGKIATKLCKETSLALDILHKQGIGHGDLHTGNIAFADHELSLLSEQELSKKLGPPKIGQVTRSDGSLLGREVPDYLVWSARLPTTDLEIAKASIKLIDFGESFFLNNRTKTLHTPLAMRAPELLFDDDYDLSVDSWALGCTMFELIVGQPPISGLLAKKGDILQQIADLIGEPPER
ncbi:kinase-like protein [Aureobasidium subglaciale]|nr:kinase-like protein [Aureobasidium subglaciale]